MTVVRDTVTSAEVVAEKVTKEAVVKEKSTQVIKVSESDMPVCCPPKDQAHWNMHPRVYLELSRSKSALCPYCGNRFEIFS